MNETKLATLEQIREFLAGTSDVAFATPADELRLRVFVTNVLRRFRYFSRPKGQRGLLFEYMQRLSGYSRQHLSRLIAQFRDTHSIEPATRASRTSFSRKYQAEDLILLAQTDNLHDTLSGPATQVLLRRAFSTFGDLRYERRAQISVSHLYNLRTSVPYLKHRLVWRKTRPSPIPIGIRKAPAPHGLPGYIRIDTVHQGDRDGVKGVYHINAVDIVTQWELVAAVEHISEAFLLPVIALLLEGFPFVILGFHSDGGSEFINHEIAGLLEKLRVEFTRSRPRHTNDNALAESKNGAVIRKIMGYSHIPQKHAAVINRFYSETLNPYLNFHRPCYFALDTIDAKGKIKKTYPHELIKTPFQRLQSVKDYALHLKPGITPKGLEHQAAAMSDNEAAKQVQQARKLLFNLLTVDLKPQPKNYTFSLILRLENTGEALNRGQILPSTRTWQRELGVQVAVTPKVKFVAGVFDVHKPYFNLDIVTKLYVDLATQEHRGFEFSLAGEIVKNLNLVVRLEVLDPKVT